MSVIITAEDAFEKWYDERMVEAKEDRDMLNYLSFNRFTLAYGFREGFNYVVQLQQSAEGKEPSSAVR